MCKELVRLTTQDVSRGIIITDSKIISIKVGVSHRYIKKHLNTYKEEFESLGLLVAHATESNGGRPEEIFELNEQQATFLMTLLKNKKEVVRFKLDLTKAFFLMKNELQARQETRHIGIAIRKSLTDTIRNKVDEEGRFKKFAYSNYSKLVYKKILGKTVKKAKEELGLKEKDNIRNFLNMDQLQKVQDLESKIAFYIEMRKDLIGNDKEVYQEVKKYIES